MIVSLARRAKHLLAWTLFESDQASVARLVWRRLDETPELKPYVDEYSDELAARHEGVPLEDEHFRRVIRYFQAWRVHTVRERLGDRLASAEILDVGDTDGMILKQLGKTRLGFNISDTAIRNIRANGVEAAQGDCHDLPFDDASFDVTLCFETLEHVESPYRVLSELARVTRPDGRVFISIPWVPTTNIWPRREGDRGEAHVFELARDHFHALVSHTPLHVAWESVCELLGEPGTATDRAFLWRTRNDHIVAGTFRRFQFFELAHGERR